jgi:hypothetical protein
MRTVEDKLLGVLQSEVGSIPKHDSGDDGSGDREKLMMGPKDQKEIHAEVQSNPIPIVPVQFHVFSCNPYNSVQFRSVPVQFQTSSKTPITNKIFQAKMNSKQHLVQTPWFLPISQVLPPTSRGVIP